MSGVRFQMYSGRWGREKADVGAEENETEYRRARRRGKEPLGVALATQCLSGRHTFETRTRVSLSFSFSLSLFFSNLFLSLSPSPFLYHPLSLSFSLRLCLLERPVAPSSSLRPSSCCLSALTSRTTLRHIVRALPPLAEHGVGPIGAPLPATMVLQSAHDADG